MLSIYDYMDYHCFLKDKFSEIKQKNPRFSYRVFNRLAGIKSSAFLKLVMDGKRNLADDGIRGIIKGFKMGEREGRYFETLVKFNQATILEEKNRYFHNLSRCRQFLAAKPLTVAQYRLFSNWYYVAILELVRLKTSAMKNSRWLTSRIRPMVGLREIKKAVRELKELGLLEEDKKGALTGKETMLTTPDEVQSLAVANFHVSMSRLAGQAVMEQKAREREFSALTIATTEEGFKQAKREMQAFRKKLHSILEQVQGNRTIVSQINLQLFRLSQTEE